MTLSIDWTKLPLGEKTDKQLGQELGISYTIVSYHRRKLGITAKVKGPPPKNERIDWDTVPLGMMYDKDIAEALSVHWTCVYEQRKRRGIPKFKIRTRCVCGKPARKDGFWCTTPYTGPEYLNSCSYKVVCARKWCGIRNQRGGSWSSRNHFLDHLFLALYELESTIRRKLGVKKRHG